MRARCCGSRSAGPLAAPLVAAALSFAIGCEQPADMTLPAPADLDAVYGENVDVSLNGNVVEVQFTQPARQLLRGGSIWAKAGPYIYLFTPQTRSLFVEFGGIGGVQVTTIDADGGLIARALLKRGTLNTVTWPRAINVAGAARVRGTDQPQTMVDLAEFGEEQTSYEYSRKYVGSD